MTQYPETVIKLLQEAGAKCGEGLEQKILFGCPADKFCQLPTGKICVYGLGDLGTAEQLTPFTILTQQALHMPTIALALILLVLGIVVGWAASNRM